MYTLRQTNSNKGTDIHTEIHTAHSNAWTQKHTDILYTDMQLLSNTCMHAQKAQTYANTVPKW